MFFRRVPLQAKAARANRRGRCGRAGIDRGSGGVGGGADDDPAKRAWGRAPRRDVSSGPPDGRSSSHGHCSRRSLYRQRGLNPRRSRHHRYSAVVPGPKRWTSGFASSCYAAWPATRPRCPTPSESVSTGYTVDHNYSLSPSTPSPIIYSIIVIRVCMRTRTRVLRIHIHPELSLHRSFAYSFLSHISLLIIIYTYVEKLLKSKIENISCWKHIIKYSLSTKFLDYFTPIILLMHSLYFHELLLF